MALVYWHSQTVRYIQGIFTKAKRTVKVEDYSKMEIATPVNGETVKALVKEVTTILMVADTKAKFWIVLRMDSDSLLVSPSST